MPGESRPVDHGLERQFRLPLGGGAQCEGVGIRAAQPGAHRRHLLLGDAVCRKFVGVDDAADAGGAGGGRQFTAEAWELRTAGIQLLRAQSAGQRRKSDAQNDIACPQRIGDHLALRRGEQVADISGRQRQRIGHRRGYSVFGFRVIRTAVVGKER